MTNSPGPSSSPSTSLKKLENGTSNKRTRRRSRKKNKPTPILNDSIQQNGTTPQKRNNKPILASPKKSGSSEICFSIAPVVTPMPCIFYKRRKDNYDPIKINTFIENNQIPRQFVTSAVRKDVMEKLVNLAINEGTPGPSRKRTKQLEVYSPYISAEEAKIGLESGLLKKGFIRINPKKPSEAYVGNEDSSKIDYIINSVLDMNRAMEGDEVVLQRKPGQNASDRKIMQVVYILKQVHPRIVIGVLSPYNDEWALLTPRDRRNPKVLVPKISWPNGFQTNPKDYSQILFVCKILQWQDVRFAQGTLIENVGKMGNLKVESLAILREFCLDPSPFTNYREFLPDSTEIPKSELTCREDLRKDCIFTIDPLTARDLDDAMSCRELPNGNYEIGVHISDASFYLAEGTKLDETVKEKATTIYMVDNVYHMLPLELCMLCSLLPGSDKLTFSVFWELTPSGEIVSKRITRTIINSCAQLAYEHAQQMIDEPDKDLTDQLPKIYNGYTAKDLSKCVNNLQKIAVNLRQKRIENGSLKIDQVKIGFSLNPTNGEPIQFWVMENKPAHRLIEEFMLLANMTVAEHIYEAYPDLAFLRMHEPPKATMIAELQRYLEKNGIFVDVESSGSIQESLVKYSGDDFLGNCRMAVLNHLFAKPMQRARYFCASKIPHDLTFNHYALSIPIYTHFTSPIRRYADIMVHRLLAASLNYREKPNYTPDEVNEIAEICNRQKYNAKRAGEASCELYLAHYVEQHPNFIENAVVVNVNDNSVDAIVLKTGTIVRVYNNRIGDNGKWHSEELKLDGENHENDKTLYKVSVKFPKFKSNPALEIILDIFTVIQVELTRKHKSNKLEATLLRPQQI